MMRAVCFSKDRALQLDGCLRSLALHSAPPIETWVIWTASTAAHEAGYAPLPAIHPSVRFDREGAFQSDVWAALSDGNPEHVLFLTDDTIFTRHWSPRDAVMALEADTHDNAIGVSLRLGMNTTHCYPTGDKPQRKSARSICSCGFYEHEWTNAEGDWGYPLEVSSSIYRACTVRALLDGAKFGNPNELEVVLASRSSMVAEQRPCLLTYGTSIAFSNPCNRVQNQFHNRAGHDPQMSAPILLNLWERGYRMRVESYDGYTPSAAHQVVSIVLEKRP